MKCEIIQSQQEGTHDYIHVYTYLGGEHPARLKLFTDNEGEAPAEGWEGVVMDVKLEERLNVDSNEVVLKSSGRLRSLTGSLHREGRRDG